ncbi:MAG: glycoprotease/HAD-superfamily hydrolase like protein [Dehalococcoidia bacterium]|nr:glycoprotease/HAD-superfamily hydrolase like protein [Dehalococcoidia bacterium]
MELSIDTSSSIASLALTLDEKVLAEITWRCGQNHSVELVPSIDALMVKSAADKSSLTGIIVAKGPGSFNGLRVGIATAKGLAYALKIPVVGISTLQVEAFPHLTSGLPV